MELALLERAWQGCPVVTAPASTAEGASSILVRELRSHIIDHALFTWLIMH